MFDRCPEAYEKCIELSTVIPCIQKVDEIEIEMYKFKHQYTAIVMRWCIGYPKKKDVITFLK